VSKPRVLVIDDDPIAIRTLTRALRSYEILTTSDPSEVLDLCCSFDPAVVICDYFLGDVTGREVIKAMRDAGIRSQVLLMSGTLTSNDWAEWAVFLADDFVAKPFHSDLLLYKVERLIEADSVARELIAASERDEREAEAAHDLLARMTDRGVYPAGVRILNAPARRFGGDVVLASNVGDRYRLFVGDVTGHTLASALVTIPLSMIFYGASRNNVPMRELLETMNEQLGHLLPRSMFCAAVMLELDRSAGRLTAWSGGAPDVAVLRGDGSLLRIPSTSPPLAVLRNIPLAPELSEHAIAAGDRILAFTDGLYEVMDLLGGMLGLERVLAAATAGAPDGAFDRMVAARTAHQGGRKPDDDVCLVEVAV